jgi:16S rRNA (adenine1518-N6/adenine1519-N6)-dimethyltransferase
MMRPGDILHRYGIVPRKGLSQSFLMDNNIIKKIADAAQVSSEDVVVEIGSGIGVLTDELAKSARQVIAVEIDIRLMEILKDSFAGCSHVEMISGDILKLNLSSISSQYGSKLHVVGNVPYSISSPVIFQLLSYRSVIRGFTLMLQKEVVERLVSPPDNKSYGVPSVLLQMYAHVERLFDVSANCFYPRPKVESSIIRGMIRKKPLVDAGDENLFSRLVKSAFARRRKMLFNSLKGSGLLEEYSEFDIKEALEDAGIDGRRRAETLSVEEFGYLSHLLFLRQSKKNV